MVAPNGARRTKSDHPLLPITIGEVVEAASKCFEQGAEALHAHVRDEDGKHILDAGLYRELIAEMAQTVPGMEVQITTEAVGIYSPQQQRDLVHDVMPKAVSVSLAEMLSDGDENAAKGFYRSADEAEIAVQHILYSADDVERFHHCITNGVIPNIRHQLLFVLGRYAKDQQSSPADLDPFLNAMSSVSGAHDWAVCAFGKEETQCLLAAARLGGKCRIGFENSLWNAEGALAKDNAERVRELASMITQDGLDAG